MTLKTALSEQGAQGANPAKSLAPRDDHGLSPQDIADYQRQWGKGPHLTVDLVIFTLRPRAQDNVGELCVLLIERGIAPFRGEMALPGGYVQPQEDLEAAARRELAEETAIEDLGHIVVEQLATFGAPHRDPRARTVTVAHTALVPWERVEHARGGDDAAPVTFARIQNGATLDETGQPLRLAFDHADIVQTAVARLQGRVTYTTAPFALMPEEFTLAELQGAYEAILGAPLHRRAFRERIEREGWVVPTGRQRGGAHRPARTFRAATRELLWMRPWPEAAKVTGTLLQRSEPRTRSPQRC